MVESTTTPTPADERSAPPRSHAASIHRPHFARFGHIAYAHFLRAHELVQLGEFAEECDQEQRRELERRYGRALIARAVTTMYDAAMSRLRWRSPRRATLRVSSCRTTTTARVAARVAASKPCDGDGDGDGEPPRPRRVEPGRGPLLPVAGSAPRLRTAPVAAIGGAS